MKLLDVLLLPLPTHVPLQILEAENGQLLTLASHIVAQRRLEGLWLLRKECFSAAKKYLLIKMKGSY